MQRWDEELVRLLTGVVLQLARLQAEGLRMAKNLDDVKAVLTDVEGKTQKLGQDLLAAIEALKHKSSAGQDLTEVVDRLTQVGAQLATFDEAALLEIPK